MALVGFDIARSQWGMNVAAIPHDFAIIGASDGGAVNPYFHQQYATEKALRKLRGAYHFFRGNTIAEARFFVANAREVAGDGQIWCDAETFFPDLPQRTLGWLEEVRRLTGVKPSGAYVPADFLLNRGLDWSPVKNAGYEVWEAAYVLGYTPLNAYTIPGGRAPIPLWGSPVMWQYTSTGMVPGWHSGIDLNIFYGDAAKWNSLIGSGVSPDSTSIKPIEQDWLDMASKQDIKDAFYEELCAPRSVKAIVQAVWNIAGGTRGGKQISMWRNVTEAGAAITEISPLLEKIEAKPVGTATIDVHTLDTLVTRLKAELPAATLAQIKAKL